MESKYINDYEYSNFSQNGEDGIIDFLTKKLIVNKKIFIEIGCGNGLENNSTNLILNNWMGFVCDIPHNIYLYNRFIKALQPSEKIQSLGIRVNSKNIEEIAKKFLNYDTSFFSLDIDSYDFFIMLEFLKEKIFPKIICVEYNSFLGKEPFTVKYKENFKRYIFDKDRGLYFGSSLEAWQILFKKYNYKFICVDKSGVNAFFILPEYFKNEIFEYKGLQFQHNIFFEKKYGKEGEYLEKELLNKFKNDLVNINDLI